MKTILLCGGKGLRLPEETSERPKPLVEIGSQPILTHLMKIYSHYNYNDFIICLGYKGYMIKDYFLHFYEHINNIYIDLETGEKHISSYKEPWKINLLDTGENTATAGRMLFAQEFLNPAEPFMMNYSDGLSNVNIREVVNFHNKHKKLATFVAVNNPSKFGTVSLSKNGTVEKFGEKVQDGSYINGGFFVLQTEVFKYIKDSKTSWEFDVLPELVRDHQLMAYKYDGFWKCMDSLKDKIELEEMWNSGKAAWKVW